MNTYNKPGKKIMAVILALLILAGLGAFVYLLSEKNPEDEQVAQSAYPGSAVTTPTPTPTPPSLTQLYEEELEKLEEIYPTGQPLHLPTTPAEEESTAEENEAVPTAAPTGTPVTPGTPVTAGTPAEEQQEVSLYYYYSLLNEEEKAIYDQVLEGLSDRSDSFDVNGAVEDERFEQISHYVFCDHPELFWFSGPYSRMIYSDHFVIEYQYSLTPEEVAERSAEIETAAGEFLAAVDENLSDYEKIKAAYDYLCRNVAYLHSPDDQNIYSALVNHETVCEGYSRAMQYLLQQMGIPCILAEGDSPSGSHAWNVVLCDNVWYNVDVTWGDAEENSDGEVISSPEEAKINYAYLLSDDQQFYDQEDRVIDDRFFTGLLPACTDPSLKYYPSHGLYFENTEDAWSAVKEGLNNGNRIFQCQFANEELRNAFLEEARNGRYSQMAYDIMGYQGRWGANFDANQSCTLNIWLADS